MGLISHLPLGKLGRATGTDRLGFFWSGSTNSHLSFWDKLNLFYYMPPWTGTPPPSLIWWPSSFFSKVLYVMVGSLLFYIFIKLTFRMVIILLHRIFDWATPANLKTLQEVVDKHSTQTLQNIRNLGNYVILIDKSLEELRKEAGLAREVQEALRGISKDVMEIRELEKNFTKFVSKVSTRLDNLGEQNDHMSHNLASTMKILVGGYEKSHNAMEKGLIDDESFARSYRMVQEGKGPRLGIPYLQSVRKMLDPNAEITVEVGRISHILQSKNEHLKEAQRHKESSPTETEEEGTSSNDDVKRGNANRSSGNPLGPSSGNTSGGV